MLGVRHYLGAEQGDDMVGDDFMGFVLEVGIIDTEVRIEPVDFSSDEFARDEALRDSEIGDRIMSHWFRVSRDYQTLPATSCSTSARCSSLPWNTGVVYPGMFLTRFKGSLLLSPSLGTACAATEGTGVDIGKVVRSSLQIAATTDAL